MAALRKWICFAMLLLFNGSENLEVDSLPFIFSLWTVLAAGYVCSLNVLLDL